MLFIYLKSAYIHVFALLSSDMCHTANMPDSEDLGVLLRAPTSSA